MSKFLRTFGNTVLGACLASLIAVPGAGAQTTEASKSENPQPPAQDSASTVPAQSSPKGDTGSAASVDNYIPGSEVLPTAQTSPTQSDEFVKNQKPTMDLALLLHKNREFRQALIVLKKLPQTEQTRYYSGLCYKGLGNQREATTQFAWLAYYAKDPRLKQYALTAIRSMKPTKPATNTYTGGSTSTKYSSAQARQRSEEIVSRIQAQLRNRAAREE